MGVIFRVFMYLIYLKSLFFLVCLSSFGEYPEMCKGCPALCVPGCFAELWFMIIGSGCFAPPKSCVRICSSQAPLFCGSQSQLSKTLRETALGFPRAEWCSQLDSALRAAADHTCWVVTTLSSNCLWELLNNSFAFSFLPSLVVYSLR